MNGPALTAEEIAHKERLVREWLDMPIVGHGLWARYQDAREMLVAFLADLRAARAEVESLTRKVSVAKNAWRARVEVLTSALRDLLSEVESQESQYVIATSNAFENARALVAVSPPEATENPR